ncbi:hypothetical protein BDZ85DRAFT_235880 [Elsinoe ampelina]|uniref:Galactose oxidase n=1 Tax=Elsinoe ampelina TaxID=302913 RepID=A0A6A6GDB4_9PEZI|nr:hypothetical protein BDZ85DRAFT_235880 [Elsinoe ampelina]
MRPLSLPARYFSTVSLLICLVSASNLPYNPTRIHLSNQPDGKPHAYILQPGSDSTTSAQLSSLDLSNSIDSSNPKPKSLSSTLPFVTANKATAYTSFVDQSGNITVLSGDCSKGADGASLWRLKPDNGAQNGGTWSQDKVVAKDLKGQDSVSGANFLNAAVAFSELVGGNATDTDLYAFGGMCPDTGASDSTWTTTAQYSNVMVTYSPQDDTKEEDDYKVALITSKGPPIAEAGMSMTPLSPTFSNTSGVQTQQQDFVVLGGHTQSAFINMSQVAMFSLPQAIWSFLPVQQPGGAIVPTDSNFVTPRSGHTAVLSEDGRSIIIYGGWVGDVNTPASPQIAILHIASGYGGTGAWKWSTVSMPGGSFSGGLGLYGHGAVMLPGNVMMIMGGYTISTSSSKLSKRAGPMANTRTFLYNVTTNSWVTSYSAPPEALAAISGDQPTSTGLQTPSQKAGVGIGVTFGVIALAGAGVLYLWHSKRSKRQRLNRDSMAMNLTNEKPTWDDGWNTHTLTHGRIDYDPGRSEYHPDSPEREAFPWLPQIGQSWKTEQAKRREVDSTGAFLNIPSPTRGLRRASGGRNYTVTSPIRGTFGHRPQYSFDQLRNEGELLLGPSTDLQSSMAKKRPVRPASSLYSDNFDPDLSDHDGDITPTSPTRKRLNWVGSIRRALGSYNPIDLARSASATFHAPIGPVEQSQLMSSYSDRSQTPSPTKSFDQSDPTSTRSKPRRTASDSSAFLALKRGKDDWATPDEKSAWEPYRDEPDGGDWGVPDADSAPAPVLPLKSARRKTRANTGKSVNFADDDHDASSPGEKRGSQIGEQRYSRASGNEEEEDDWDVEREAAKRDVQIMFTVPKARLRVVNADPSDRGSLRSVSAGSRGSGKSPRIGGGGEGGR